MLSLSLYVVLGFSVVTGVLRAITAVPGHFCYGVIMGYFMSKARYNKENGKSGIIYILLSILIPTALHALYDYLILDDTGLNILIWFVLIIAMFISCFILIIRAAKNNAPIGAPEEPVVSTPAQTAATAPVASANPATPAAQIIQPAVPTEPVAPVVTQVAPAPAPAPTPTINTAPVPTVAAEPAPAPQTTNTTNTTQADSITTISWETGQNGQNNS